LDPIVAMNVINNFVRMITEEGKNEKEGRKSEEEIK